MKKIATLVFALLLAGSLSFAQAGGSTATDKDKAADSGKKDEKGKKGKKGKKGEKGEKGKKGSEPTPPPK